MSNEIEQEKLKETSALPKPHGTSVSELAAKVKAGKTGAKDGGKGAT